MLSLNKTLDTAISIESATARLTETILGNDDHDLAETLRTIASDIGLSHISYVLVARQKPRYVPIGCDRHLFTTLAASILCKEIYVPRPGDFLRS